MSDSAPDVVAFRELDALVRHLGDELSGFRRRALQAEGRIRQLEDVGGAAATLDRLETLERENADLRRRLEAAAERTQALLDRVRFLRQQGVPEEK
ncbi:MAG TPA: hypothetical protein VFZ11_05310 [Gemmatimonadaceae bacterium]